jgi:hypothetical protein
MIRKPLLFCLFSAAFFSASFVPQQDIAATRKADAQVFLDAYPEAGAGLVGKKDGLYISTANGKEILFSPWEGYPSLPHSDAQEDAPLCASLIQKYPEGEGHREPAPGFEPGRVRNKAFLKTLYGENAGEVEKNLETVDFFGTKLRFSTRHGTAKALQRVIGKLEEAVGNDPALKAYILPSGGTYAWRKISKSPRLSAHSFGICIDLNIEKGIYWQWKPAQETIAAVRKNYPQIIVDAFEEHGFIWGGKWRSFDYMHFEYRSELFQK